MGIHDSGYKHLFSFPTMVKVWFTRAQKPAKIIHRNDAVDNLAPEEIEPMLSERIEKWSKELVQQGRAEGKEEGIAEGKEEGIAEGKEESKAEGVQEVARNLLKKGMSVADIAEVTGLTEKYILALFDTETH